MAMARNIMIGQFTRSYRRTVSKQLQSLFISRSSYHVPVFLDECCKYLNIRENGLYVDCTLGGGGHTKEILSRGGKVIGLDQDIDAISTSTELLDNYLKSSQCELIQDNFRNIVNVVKAKSNLASKNGRVDGILLDLGISSHQIDVPDRGFAFGKDGPLDMRMNATHSDDPNLFTAATIINTWDKNKMANLFYEFGDETRSRRIAQEIVLKRPFQTTSQLAQVITDLVPWKETHKTLARCFQALRIAVNDEMGALHDCLQFCHAILKPGGRLVILSYHSLEDGRVKWLLKGGVPSTSSVNQRGGIECLDPRLDPNSVYFSLPSSLLYRQQKQQQQQQQLHHQQLFKNKSLFRPVWKPLFNKVLTPSANEISLNPRSRSAKLRVGIRLPLTEEEDEEYSLFNISNK